MLTRTVLPKLAPDVISRERLAQWFQQHADVPLRLLCAPAGSGKTTALAAYAAASKHPAYYIALHRGMSAAEVRAVLLAAVGASSDRSDEGLFSSLSVIGRCELLIDEADRGGSDVRAFLEQLVYDAPANVTLVYASRSRDVVDATRLVATGLARVLDAERLAFTIDEAQRYLERIGLDADRRDVGRLLHDTEGWAFAFCSTVRDAFASGDPLSAAFERFRRSPLLRRFVDSNLAGETESLVTAARRVYDGALVLESELDSLETRGLFVRWDGAAYRPYRAIARGARVAATPDEAATLQPFEVRLFGALDVRFGGRAVAWFRRRDAQIFTYLLMQPQGRATRAQLLEAFWPDTSPRIAAQTLRSTCSTMRRSLAALVGYADLPHYLAVGDEIALNLDLFSVDARRVEAHLLDASAAAGRGERRAEREHELAALRLASAPLLDGAPPPCLEERVAWFRSRLAGISTRAGDELPPLLAAMA